MNIKFLDLKAQYLSIKGEIDTAIQKVLFDTAFSAGPYVKSFEENFAKRHGMQYCVSMNSGTAALHAALMALGIKAGDEVIVPANTFFATPEAVSLAGARPVFVDCEPVYYNIDTEKIEDSITDNSKAIIAVNLYGQAARLDIIKEIADKHNLLFIEDCAQAHIAEYKDKSVGSYGACGCFSFYCGKNLGAYGEGGAVVTNDKDLYKKMMMIRDHGASQKYHHEIIGHNYRMAGIQGAILDVKLKYLDEWTEIRRRNANLYRKYLSDCKEIVLPEEMPRAKHVYHLFVIRAKRRNKLTDFLKRNGISTGLHYPIPCHLQNAYKFLGYKKGNFPVSEKYSNEILSLPMSEQLKEEEVKYVSEKIKEFYM